MRVLHKDYIQAYAWYNISAAQGKKHSRLHLDLLSEKMKPAQIEEAQALSREYYEKYVMPNIDRTYCYEDYQHHCQ